MRHLPACSGPGGLRKGTMASASTFVWQKAAPEPALAPTPDSLVPAHVSLVPFELLSQCWSPEPVRPSEPACGPFKRNCWGLCLTQLKSLLVFTARGYGDFSSWLWYPGPGGLVWGWDPLPLSGDLCSRDISPDFYPTRVGVTSSLFRVSASRHSLCGGFIPLVVGLPSARFPAVLRGGGSVTEL